MGCVCGQCKTLMLQRDTTPGGRGPKGGSGSRNRDTCHMTEIDATHGTEEDDGRQEGTQWPHSHRKCCKSQPCQQRTACEGRTLEMMAVNSREPTWAMAREAVGDSAVP